MSDDPHPSPAPRRARATRLITALLFVAVVVGIPVTTTTLFVARFPQLSVLDEFAHIDYVRRAEAGEIPRIGEKILPETARDVACRTIAGRSVSDCQLAEIPIEDIDAKGYSFQAQQPPIYYFVTAVLRQPFRPFVDGYVNSVRLTGMVWSAAGLGLLWWFLRRRMSASVPATALACGLLAVSPPVVGQSATVNNDAAALLIGAAALVGYDILRRDPPRRAIALLSAGAVLLVLIKPLAILPVGVVTLAILFDPRQRARGRRIGALLLPAVAAGATYQLWQIVRDLRGVEPYSVVTDALLAGRDPLTSFPLEALGVVAPRFLEVYDSLPGSVALELFVIGVASVLGLLFVLAPSISTAMGDGRRDLQPLHAGLLTVALLAPPLLITQSYLTVARSGGANARYALALLPVFVTAAVPWFERPWPRRLAALGVTLLFTVAVIGLVTHEGGT